MFNRPLMGIEDNPLVDGLFNNNYVDGVPTPPSSGDFLLLTNSDYFLLTNGDYLELPS